MLKSSYIFNGVASELDRNFIMGSLSEACVIPDVSVTFFRSQNTSCSWGSWALFLIDKHCALCSQISVTGWHAVLLIAYRWAVCHRAVIVSRQEGHSLSFKIYFPSGHPWRTRWREPRKTRPRLGQLLEVGSGHGHNWIKTEFKPKLISI